MTSVIATPASRIGIGTFVPDVTSTLDLAARAEQAGVGTLWLVMPPTNHDTPTVAAAALARTERLQVGTAIVPAFTRHPLALATQASAIDALAPGRFRLGIGTGNLSVMANVFGTPIAHPAAQLGEYARVLRDALATGSVHHSGAHYSIDAQLHPAPGMPVLIAALGPRLFTTAGEAADGAISWMCPLPYLDEVARPAMERGAAAAGRDVPRLVTHVPVVAHPSRAAALAAARPGADRFAANPQYAAMFARAGLPVAPGIASTELVDALVVSGGEAELTDRLGALAERTDELIVSMDVVDDAEAELEVLLRAVGAVERALSRGGDASGSRTLRA